MAMGPRVDRGGQLDNGVPEMVDLLVRRNRCGNGLRGSRVPRVGPKLGVQGLLRQLPSSAPVGVLNHLAGLRKGHVQSYAGHHAAAGPWGRRAVRQSLGRCSHLAGRGRCCGWLWLRWLCGFWGTWLGGLWGRPALQHFQAAFLQQLLPPLVLLCLSLQRALAHGPEHAADEGRRKERGVEVEGSRSVELQNVPEPMVCLPPQQSAALCLQIWAPRSIRMGQQTGV